jgi:hypothetical protein
MLVAGRGAQGWLSAKPRQARLSAARSRRASFRSTASATDGSVRSSFAKAERPIDSSTGS